MSSSNLSPSLLNFPDEQYSHCCVQKYGTAKKWMKDDFNFKEIKSNQVSLFNKIKLNQLEGIPIEHLNVNTASNAKQFTLLVDGQFYKMVQFSVSSEQLKDGDLIHYIITAERGFILCNESRFDDVLGSLSNREKEVLILFAKGHSMTRVAKLLFLSPHTIDSHRINLCKKLQVKRITELAVWAHKLGLLSDIPRQAKAS